MPLNLNGGKDRAYQFLNGLEIIDISNNLGDAKSLICHPATTTHQRLTDEEKDRVGITPGFVRLSVGLEAVEDLIADLDQALAACTNTFLTRNVVCLLRVVKVAIHFHAKMFLKHTVIGLMYEKTTT